MYSRFLSKGKVSTLFFLIVFFFSCGAETPPPPAVVKNKPLKCVAPQVAKMENGKEVCATPTPETPKKTLCKATTESTNPEETDPTLGKCEENPDLPPAPVVPAATIFKHEATTLRVLPFTAPLTNVSLNGRVQNIEPTTVAKTEMNPEKYSNLVAGDEPPPEVPKDGKLAEWQKLATEKDCFSSYKFGDFQTLFHDYRFNETLKAHDDIEAAMSAGIAEGEVGDSSEYVKIPQVYLVDFYILKENIRNIVDAIRCAVAFIPFDLVEFEKKYDYQTQFTEFLKQQHTAAIAAAAATTTPASLVEGQTATEEATSTPSTTSEAAGSNSTVSGDSVTDAAQSTADPSVTRFEVTKFKDVLLGSNTLPAQVYKTVLQFTLPFPEGQVSIYFNGLTKNSSHKAKGDSIIIIETKTTEGVTTRQLVGYRYYMRFTEAGGDVVETSLDLTHIPNGETMSDTEVADFKNKIVKSSGKVGLPLYNKTYIHKYLRRYPDKSTTITSTAHFGKYEALFIDQATKKAFNPILSYDWGGACASMHVIGDDAHPFTTPKKECFAKDKKITWKARNGALFNLVPILDHPSNRNLHTYFDEVPNSSGNYYFDINYAGSDFSLDFGTPAYRLDEDKTRITYNINGGEGKVLPPETAAVFLAIDYFNSDRNGTYWNTYCQDSASNPFICAHVISDEFETVAPETTTATTQ